MLLQIARCSLRKAYQNRMGWIIKKYWTSHKKYIDKEQLIVNKTYYYALNNVCTNVPRDKYISIEIIRSNHCRE